METDAAVIDEIALRATQIFFALVVLADGAGIVNEELGESREALGLLQGLGLIEAGPPVRVLDIEDYVRDQPPLVLAEQVMAVMRGRCA